MKKTFNTLTRREQQLVVLGVALASMFLLFFINSSLQDKKEKSFLSYNQNQKLFLNQFYINRIIKKISSEKNSMLTVDLKKQIIIMDQNEVLKFKVDSYRKKCLLEGLDDISLTLNKDTLISKYEFNLKKKLPWLDK